MTDLRRRLVAEGLGTAALVATVVGSGIMAQRLTDDLALQLLANALPTGAMLVVLITVLSPLSGAHFNPAVTLVFALRGEIGVRPGALYAACQIIGALLGTMLAHAMFGLPLLEVGAEVRTGPAQWLAEVVATFGLIAVILGGRAARRNAVPSLVGLYIAAAYWFTASTSFANPAVTLARGFTTSFSGIRLIDVPGFIVAQIIGALLGAAALWWLTGKSAEAPRRRQQRGWRASCAASAPSMEPPARPGMRLDRSAMTEPRDRWSGWPRA